MHACARDMYAHTSRQSGNSDQISCQHLLMRMLQVGSSENIDLHLGHFRIQYIHAYSTMLPKRA